MPFSNVELLIRVSFIGLWRWVMSLVDLDSLHYYSGKTNGRYIVAPMKSLWVNMKRLWVDKVSLGQHKNLSFVIERLDK